VIRNLNHRLPSRRGRRVGSVFAEYLLLVTIVGIGIIAGLAVVREALVSELHDMAQAINAIRH
jgi:Flp pilus assembly pilin Flp